jgi:predicted oxidoreductase
VTNFPFFNLLLKKTLDPATKSDVNSAMQQLVDSGDLEELGISLQNSNPNQIKLIVANDQLEHQIISKRIPPAKIGSRD